MDRREYRDKRLRPVSHGLCCTAGAKATVQLRSECRCQCHGKSASPQTRDKQAVAIQQGVR